MADSKGATPRHEEARSRLHCAYCPDLDADVCVRITPSASGAGHAVYAHRACAQTRGDTVLYTVTGQPTERAS